MHRIRGFQHPESGYGERVSVPLTTYTCRLTQAQAQALEAWMRAQNFFWRDVPHARFAGEKGKLNLVFYESG